MFIHNEYVTNNQYVKRTNLLLICMLLMTNMSRYEIAAVVDALEMRQFAEGEVIYRQVVHVIITNML